MQSLRTVREAEPAERIGRPWAGLAALTAGAWLVPVAAYLLHVAVLLPLVILFATASLVRGGRTLLDRLMITLGLLFGLTCAGGLVLSYWPFGLHPVAVAGTCLTALIAAAAVSGRRPNLPRPALSDLVPLLGGAAVGAVLFYPLVRDGEVRRLATATWGEDFARHANLYNAIDITGGYLFTRWDAAAQQVYEGMILYPQGSHFLDALLDNFLRSDTTATVGMATINHFWAFTVGWYALFVLIASWSAQWIGASSLTLGRRLALTAFIVAMSTTTDLMEAFITGHTSEVAGLCLILLLVAVLARPTQRTGQQLLLVGSLLVALGFTYYLFLPAAGLATAFWLVRARRRIRRRPMTLLVVGLCTAVLAPLPTVLGLLVAKQGAALGLGGGVMPSIDVGIALFAVVAGGLIASRGWRSPVWQMFALCVASVGVLSIGLFTTHAVQPDDNLGGGAYYATKTLHLLVVLLIVGCGVATRVLARPAAGRRRQPFRQGLPGTIAGAGAAVAVLAAVGLVAGDSPVVTRGNSTYIRAWVHSDGRRDQVAKDILHGVGTDPADRAVPTYFMDEEPYRGYLLTVFGSTLAGTAGQTAFGLYGRHDFTSQAQAEAMIRGTTGRIRLVTTSTSMEEPAAQLKAEYPDRDIVVVHKRW
ncbi:hypothetical protein ACFO1B_54180 [Dactylosporangium siamense]